MSTIEMESLGQVEGNHNSGFHDESMPFHNVFRSNIHRKPLTNFQEVEVIEFYQRQVRILENLLAERDKKGGQSSRSTTSRSSTPRGSHSRIVTWTGPDRFGLLGELFGGIWWLIWLTFKRSQLRPTCIKFSWILDDFGINNSQFRGGLVGMKGPRIQTKCRQVHSPRRVPPGFKLSWVIDRDDSWWLILWVPKNMHCQKHHCTRHQHPK